ncbi:hypothetical protein BC332_31056 [Capsicum chinense]|nr:hypothetical protein BC332_31056 [Capsicum chinense]
MSRGAEIVDAIMERYRHDKIPIDKFEFSNCSGSNDSDLFFVRINTWLDMALQNGKCLRELVLRGDCNLMDVSLSSGVANCYSLRKLSLSHKLKSLELKYVRISDGSLENLISRSQSLKVLMIQKCPGIGNIDSSNLESLEYIGDQIPELKMAIELRLIGLLWLSGILVVEFGWEEISFQVLLVGLNQLAGEVVYLILGFEGYLELGMWHYVVFLEDWSLEVKFRE